ncbi:MAG: AbrB/MazE/SpoVT family DNA-binding domain-containing protein [Alphaproteobacteria bacterium]
MKHGTVSMDKAGRLVLPKAVRERLHLVPGAVLSIEVREDRVELRPVESGPSLAKRDGWWVHLGRAPADPPLEEAVARHREERLGHIRK